MERLLGHSLLRQEGECANTVILRQKNAAARNECRPYRFRFVNLTTGYYGRVSAAEILDLRSGRPFKINRN
jgi:hypothetical protein